MNCWTIAGVGSAGAGRSGAAASGWPHSAQNLAPGGAIAPQLAQLGDKAAPQFIQKRPPSGLTV
jgi:hypothetical protein